MRVRKLQIMLAAMLLLAVCTPTRAEFTWGFRQDYPTAAAIAGDPNLANMQSYVFFVTTEGDWLSAGLRATLQTGQSFYRVPGAAPLIWNPFGTPAQQFTTSVTSPPDFFGDIYTTIDGGFPGSTASNGSASSISPGTFSVTWSDSIQSAPGSYDLARLTFPLSSSITGYHFEVTALNRFGEPVTIPEPDALGLLTLVGIRGQRRRTVRANRSQPGGRQ